MKVMQETEDAPNDRKIIKSQVEKRRRERMNRSLEHLRTLLLQEPQQLGGTPRRVEKTEILERTVLFLQNTVKEENRGAGGQKHSFQDGFSSCLQRAARFLGPEGKGLWPGAALDASFTNRISRPEPDSSGVRGRTGAPSSLPHKKLILQMLREKSQSRLQRRASAGDSSPHHYQLLVQQSPPGIPQRQNQLEAGKQSPSQRCTDSVTLWRPWP
ncbi:transcription factor HES-2-like [Aulostomus maculatus]